MTKYHAQPCIYDDIHFDSKAEMMHYRDLKLIQFAGDIEDLKAHPKFVIWEVKGGKKRNDRIEYEGDFSYTENGRQVVEDVKGVETAVFRLKAKMFRARYPDIDFRIIKGK